MGRFTLRPETSNGGLREWMDQVRLARSHCVMRRHVRVCDLRCDGRFRRGLTSRKFHVSGPHTTTTVDCSGCKESTTRRCKKDCCQMSRSTWLPSDRKVPCRQQSRKGALLFCKRTIAAGEVVPASL